MNSNLISLCQRVKFNIITSTTAAGSGHPSSSLSAVELLTTLFFGGTFKQDIFHFENPLNDKFVLSKGHAAPLLYSLYEAAGVLTHEELLTLRKFGSRLEGHPTPSVPFVDVTTGSLGQGLSVGLGMALGLKLKAQNSKLQAPNVFVLLGDSEIAEGQNYEALQLASHYKLNNLIGILDVNRLGQRGETQLGWDTEAYKKRVESFGWNTIFIENGNDIAQVQAGFSKLLTTNYQLLPTMIIAKTKKGAGVSFMENADNWHGKAIPKDKLEQALKEVGTIDLTKFGVIEKPGGAAPGASPTRADSRFAREHWRGTEPRQNLASPTSTREAYGYALADLAKQNPQIIVLDAETSNSTYAEFVKRETPGQFIECFIAEQNMISMALGLSKVGFVPFASSFAAFLSRAFDQIRMSQYSVKTSLNQTYGSFGQYKKDKLIVTEFNQFQPISTINIVGSHAGCSIGVDGASQMALEDISMMRSIRKSTVLYPSDGISAYKLTQTMASHPGINYLRTTREKTPTIYSQDEEFPIGGLKFHLCHPDENRDPVEYHNSKNGNKSLDPRLHGDDTKYTSVIISAGITLHESLKAQKILEQKQIHTIVVDLYSIKPLDSKTLSQLAQKTNHIIVVEDHYETGGIGEAVLCALRRQNTEDRSKNNSEFLLLSSNISFTHLCVRKEPRSGTPEELLRYEEIDAQAIVKSVEDRR